MSQELMKQIDALVAMEVRSAILACEGNPIGAAKLERDAKGERRLLELALQTIAAERDHWKAIHDNQVKRARILIERPDMPIERVKAYQLIGELQRELADLKERVQ